MGLFDYFNTRKSNLIQESSEQFETLDMLTEPQGSLGSGLRAAGPTQAKGDKNLTNKQKFDKRVADSGKQKEIKKTAKARKAQAKKEAEASKKKDGRSSGNQKLIDRGETENGTAAGNKKLLASANSREAAAKAAQSKVDPSTEDYQKLAEMTADQAAASRAGAVTTTSTVLSKSSGAGLDDFKQTLESDFNLNRNDGLVVDQLG